MTSQSAFDAGPDCSPAQHHPRSAPVHPWSQFTSATVPPVVSSPPCQLSREGYGGVVGLGDSLDPLVRKPLLLFPGSRLFFNAAWRAAPYRRVNGIFLADFEQGEIGPDLFHHACLMGLEGLVSKHKDRPYRAGRSPHWVKVKNREHPAMERVMDAQVRTDVDHL